MATLQLSLEQVNFDADVLPPLDLENPIFTVVDANTDFLTTTTTSPLNEPPLGSAIDLETPKEAESTEICSSTLSSRSTSLVFDDDDEEYTNGLALSAKYKDCLPQVHTSKGSSLTHSRRNLSSENVSYPHISSTVAQHICHADPSVLAKMELALTKSELTKEVTDSSPTVENESTLRHFTTTSDALALQESVIGNRNLQPASPAEVAQIVENIQKRGKHQANEDMHSNSRNTVKEPVINYNANAKSINKELHRFPSDRIVTVTERKSWFSSSSAIDGVPVNDLSQISQQKRIKKGSSHRSCSSRSSGVSVHDTPVRTVHNLALENSYDHASFKPETEMMLAIKNSKHSSRGSCSTYSESNYSDRFELESNYSDRFETMSNFSDMSNISGIEEEMFRIKKLLLEVPSLPDNHPDFQKHSVVLGKTAGIVVSGTPEMARAVVDQDVFFELQRYKANLEGQLEYTRSELEELASEKATLLAKLGNVEAQLKTQMVENQLNDSEKRNLLLCSKKAQEFNKTAEMTIAQLRQSVESKTNELHNLKEDVKETEESYAQLKLELEEYKMKEDTKDSIIQGLKSKVAEIHVELQLANQAKIQIDNSHKSLRSEMDVLTKSREWYQQQLYATQDSLAKVQQDFIASQNQNIVNGNAVDKLRSENVQIRQQLVETQQRAMKEKEVLMRHLQTIEADMMEREATFTHLQRDKGMAEESLMARMRKVEEEKARLSNTVFNVTDLEHQLESAKQELEFKDKTMAKLEKDFAEVIKQYTIAQKMVNEQNVDIGNLEQKCSQYDHRLKEMQVDFKSKDEQLVALKDEKTQMEIALAAANKERINVDEALQNVKVNLEQLNANFKKMKKELASKMAAIEQLQRENRQLEEQLAVGERASMTAQMMHEKHATELLERDTLIEELKRGGEEKRNELKIKMGEIERLVKVEDELKSYKAKTNGDIEKLTKDKMNLENELKLVSKEKQEMTSKLVGSKKENGVSRRDTEDTTLSLHKVVEQKLKLKNELGNLYSSLDSVHSAIGNGKARRNSQDLSDGTIILQDVDTTGKNFANMDINVVKELVVMELNKIHAALEGNEKWVETYLEEKRSLELKVENLTRENKLMTHQIKSRETAEDETPDDSLSQVTKQIEFQLEVHRRKVRELEDVLLISGTDDASGNTKTNEVNTQTDNVSFMKHILQQDDEIRNASSNEIAMLETTLSKMEQDHKERIRIYESNIKLLTRKLKESMKAKKKMETDLKEAMVNTQVNGDAQRQISTSVEKESSQPTRDATKSHPKQRDLKKEVFHYRAKAKDLQMKLDEMQTMYKEMKQKVEANEMVTLELEKEKGRLEGISENNVALKRHTSELEIALAEKEATVSVMDLTAKGIVKRKEEEDSEIKLRLDELETAFDAEKSTTKELRKQIFNGKREISSLRKQISSLRTGLDNANQLITTKNEESSLAQATLDQNNQLKAKLQMQLDSMNAERNSMLKELEHLKQMLVENETKDSLLAEQMKTLGWHLRAKTQELDALKEQFQHAENLHLIEIQGLKNKLQDSMTEIGNTKKELLEVMQEKFSYQTKLTELRNTLTSSVEQNKVLKLQMSDKDGISSDFVMNLNIPESPTPFNEELITALLKESAVIPQSRPLGQLQLCLHTLKQEMDVLQKQILDDNR